MRNINHHRTLKVMSLGSVMVGAGMIIDAVKNPSPTSLYKAFYGVGIIAGSIFFYYDQSQQHTR